MIKVTARLMVKNFFHLFSGRIVFIGGGIFLITVLLHHLYLRKDLHDGLLDILDEVAPILLAYENAGDRYSFSEKLQLVHSDVLDAFGGAPGSYIHLINIEFELYSTPLPKTPDQNPRPFLTVQDIPETGLLRQEIDLTGEGEWFVRTGLSWPNYLLRQALVAFVVLFLVGLPSVTYRALSEVSRRQRFDSLIEWMVRFLGYTTENTLIHAVPDNVAQMLNFDAVGLYLKEGTRIVPKAAYFPKGDVTAFLGSTDDNPILIHSDFPEAQAFRGDKPIVVSDFGPDSKVHRDKLRVTGPRPYIIVAIRSSRNEPIGLLTAQYHRGLSKEHVNFLTNAAHLVALLIERFRAREAQDRMMQEMIRNTRKVTIGTVVPFVAHNMKTPLTVVTQLCKTLQRTIKDSSNEENETLFNRVRAQIDHCFELLQTIAQYDRLGKVKHDKFVISDGLDKVCDFFKEYFQIRGIALNKLYQGKISKRLTIELDELDFLQVITNLLVNAEESLLELADKEMAAMRTPDLRIGISSDYDSARSTISIAIEDTGPGIPPENAEKIFEDGFTTKEFGTGVGLPYCRRVIEMAGGKLTVEGSNNDGARFMIQLPVKSPSNVQSKAI